MAAIRHLRPRSPSLLQALRDLFAPVFVVKRNRLSKEQRERRDAVRAHSKGAL